VTKRTLTKAGRMTLLHHLRQDGLLEGLTLQEIGAVLGLNRSTIMRDLRELDAVEAEYRHIMATQPWLRREFSTSDVATELGITPDTVRALIADGLLEADKRDEQWHIPLSELQRWRDFRGAASAQNCPPGTSK